jgi:hypothetical protein
MIKYYLETVEREIIIQDSAKSNTFSKKQFKDAEYETANKHPTIKVGLRTGDLTLKNESGHRPTALGDD